MEPMSDPKWVVQRAVLDTDIPSAAKLIMMVLLDKSSSAAELGKFSPTTRKLMAETG